MDVLLLATRYHDVWLMTRWLNDPEVVKWTRHVPGEATIESELQYMRDCWDRGDTLRTIIYDGKPVGTIHLSAPVEGVSNVSLMIGEKQYWGQGVGTKAIKEITDYAFRYTSVQELRAGMVLGNIGSYKAFIKAGYYGELEWRGFEQKGKFHWVRHVQLTKQRWEDRQ